MGARARERRCRSRGRPTRAVAAVHQVLGELDGQIARGSCPGPPPGVGDAHQRAHHLPGVPGPFDHHQQGGAAGDEGHQVAEERLALVLGVVAPGRLGVDRAQLGGDQREALALEAADDLADQAPLDGVGLADDEGPVHGRAGNLARRRSDRAGVRAAPDDVERAGDEHQVVRAGRSRWPARRRRPPIRTAIVHAQRRPRRRSRRRAGRGASRAGRRRPGGPGRRRGPAASPRVAPCIIPTTRTPLCTAANSSASVAAAARRRPGCGRRR